MTPLQISQMKSSGGINKLAAEHIEYLQKTIDVANTIMKEKQEKIDNIKCVLEDQESYINQLKEMVDALK